MEHGSAFGLMRMRMAVREEGCVDESMILAGKSRMVCGTMRRAQKNKSSREM
jgi:hypothetical protein